MGSSLQAIYRNWRKHFVTQVSAVIVLTATYTAALFILLSATSIKDLFYHWGKVTEATVYLTPKTDDKVSSEIQEYVGSQKFVKKVVAISSVVASKNFTKKYGDLLPSSVKADELGEFFPPTLRIILKNPVRSKGEAEKIQLFSATLKSKFAVVEDVGFGQAWMSHFLKFIELFEGFSLALAIVILICSLFITSNVLKTVLFSKQEEIEILELVGATRTTIYAPQVLNTLIISSVSFALSLLTLSMVSELILQHFSTISIFNFQDSEAKISWNLVFMVYGILQGLVLLSSVLSVAKIIPPRLKANQRKRAWVRWTLGKQNEIL